MMKRHPTAVDLFAAGAVCRKQAPRRALAAWDPAARRRDPLHLLDAAFQGRLEDLRALKEERMAASPFSFFRGAVAVMAYDLSLAPSTGILTQLCGDAHLQNLGAYAGIDGRLTFDVNDFDETLRGPFEWDVKRLATSVLLAARSARIAPASARRSTRAFLASYCSFIEQFARLPVLDVARFQVHRLRAAGPVSRVLRKAERATPLHLLDRLTVKAGKSRHFRSAPPLLHRVTGKEREQVLASLSAYAKTLLPERQHFFSQFTPVDVAFKVVGTGSVGLRDYCVLLEGNGPADPLFLQIKEEAASAYAPYLPASAVPQKHQGQRVAEGQRAMQLQTDPLLGWTRIAGRDFLVRQLNDHKAALDLTKIDANGLTQYAQLCGELLARGHARSADARLIAGYIGRPRRFIDALTAFAHTYTAQTEADWKLLQAHRAASPRNSAGSASGPQKSRLPDA